ncbi:MAG: HD domain-containing protein [Spirochaetales bacterium]|uniref:HD domain-containing protein n=1 Tax=Candidatus Thalassospirochaeta sargassi TaxID=3119039 RepID=A0AAJ1IAX0_9SPIO|nr:HD domain-containing protein [Spirochaetales bacterium]
MEDNKTVNRPTAVKLLGIIFDYLTKIASERSVDKILRLIADFGRDVVSADRCTVWLLDEKKDILWTRVAHGVDRIEISRNNGIAGEVATTGEPLIINDPYSDPRFDKEVDKKTGYTTYGIIALPIRDSDGNMIGVVQVLNSLTPLKKFTKKDQQHLMLAASYAGNQLEAVMLQEEMENTQREIIFTLAETGEMRSKETGNHVKRVAEYSRILAELYGLSETEALLLKTASPLHDIGKIAIPDSILLKNGPLNDEERKIMMGHTTLGYEMLKHSDRKTLKAAAAIALHHHEKWDGSGYPNGLKGDEINLYGRITAIGDVFDALACPRVYKPAWEKKRVIETFRKDSGTHFDPVLTKLFLDNFEQFWKVHNTLSDNR